ncbi:RDD family protein [Halobacillus fulvus]|nr:RDD family protein [Halobacillus fulvus]
MKPITKKRIKATLIDLGISTVVSLSLEQLLRKKIKSEAFHALVTPTVTAWALECAQLKSCGQTIGYKAAGLKLENESGGVPSASQIAKRIAYRDTVSTIDYFKDRTSFEKEDGSILPHDRYAETIVKETEKTHTSS